MENQDSEQIILIGKVVLIAAIIFVVGRIIFGPPQEERSYIPSEDSYSSWEDARG